MKEQNYKLKISINGVEIETAGDKKFVEKHFDILVDKYLVKDRLNASSVLSKSQNISVQDKKPKMTIHQFVEKKQPKQSSPELMPVLAYYAKHFEGLEQFNESDIKKLYRRYDISKRPKNIYQAILDINRGKGYFESVPNASGYFRLTEAGEHFIETKLSKD